MTYPPGILSHDLRAGMAGTQPIRPRFHNLKANPLFSKDNLLKIMRATRTGQAKRRESVADAAPPTPRQNARALTAAITGVKNAQFL